MSQNGVLDSNIIESQVGLPESDQKLLNAFIGNLNLVLERQNLASNFGKMYAGDRNIPEAAGYNQNKHFTDYAAKYTYQGVATRIVNAPGDSTWQEPPEVLDGEEGETPFTIAWEKLVNFGGINFSEVTDQKSIWHYLRRIDHLSGIGRYGALVIGVRDGSVSMSEPLIRDGAKRLQDFLYLAPYDEGNITVSEIGQDPLKKRYNLPIRYTFNGNEEVEQLQNQGALTPSDAISNIHWTRVVHVAEHLRNNEIYAAPRLEPVYDLLDDLLKVTAATGESAWQLMTKGLIASTRDGFKLPKDTTNLKEAMTAFMHEQMRVLELQGMDVTLTEGDIVDPTGVVKSIIALVSAATRIPQRILIGAEAGHLASDQDEKNFSQMIMSRQVNFAEAIILRPLINRLIYVGLLPVPTSGSYEVVWPSQLLLTDLEKAQKISTEMSAMATAVGPDKLPLITFLKVVLGWPDDQVRKVLADRQIEQALSLIDFPAPPL